MKTIGMDYGTSNSCVAWHNGTTAEVIRWPDKGRTGPSVLFFPREGGDPLVGRRAVTEGREDPEFCFYHAKRMLAQRHVPGEHSGWQMAPGDDGYVYFRGPHELISPSFMAAYVLREMKECAEHRLNGALDGVVLTHPAHFSDEKKARLIEAARLVGFESSRIHLLPEPTAAAIAYGLNLDKIRTIVVADIGSGTSDVTILRAGRGLLDPIWFDGEPVGGMDIDALIVDWLREGWRELHGTDLGADGAAMARLRAAAEEAKIALSIDKSAKIDLPLIEAVPPRSLSVVLTQEKLNELAQPIIEKIIDLCARTLEKGGVTKGNIATVLLVGGQTNMPALRNALADFFGKVPQADIDPDEVVAIGAATHGAMIDKRMPGYKLTNKVSHDFGFEVAGNVFCKVIKKGEAYPIKERRVTLTNEADAQELLSVHILEGPSDAEAHQADRLAACEFQVEPLAKGKADLELVFSVNENGMKIAQHASGVIYEGIPDA